MTAPKTLIDTRPSIITGAPGLMILAIITIPLIIGLLIMAAWIYQCITGRLVVTTKSTTIKFGLLNRTTREVRHADVRAVQINQGPIQRACKTGRLSIATAGSSDFEISIPGLPEPEAVKNAIEHYREHPVG